VQGGLLRARLLEQLSRTTYLDPPFKVPRGPTWTLWDSAGNKPPIPFQTLTESDARRWLDDPDVVRVGEKVWMHCGIFLTHGPSSKAMWSSMARFVFASPPSDVLPFLT
jgi:hypothetical protein